MAKASNVGDTSKVVDHFFRHESGKIIAFLTGKFGTVNLSLAEDAVQEAMIKAMQIWPYKGIPNNPSGWMLTVSRNKMLDNLKRRSKTQFGVDAEVLNEKSEPLSDTLENINDDQLKMFFVCCDPVLSRENQIILTLKILCGFGISEISRALLKNEGAVAKAYTRAKAKLKKENIPVKMPPDWELQERLTVVLKIIYLMFNEGYSSASEEDLIRRDLCMEAMRLAQILRVHPSIQDERVLALLSLMCYQAARLNSRIDEEGNLITLEKQDRNQWDYDLVEQGNSLLTLANSGSASEYHIQASIAGLHANAFNYESTDWKTILELYDVYLKFSESGIVALNRIVAFHKVHGAKKALKELQKISKQKGILDYYLFYAIQAELLTSDNKFSEATRALEYSISLTKNKVEKKHLKKKLEYLKNV